MKLVAYLDAGAVSLVISALAAGVAGVAVVIRMGWRRFLGLFSARHRVERRSGQEADEPAPTATGSAEHRS
ncbi:hypothetical protein BH24ACT3_BH24ACT3_14510 [soil metagenome]